MRSNFSIRALRPGDAEALAAMMRPEDAAEALASAGLGPLATIETALRVDPEARALELGGELAAIFGVAPGKNGQGVTFGVPWALTTTAVHRHPRAFWRASLLVLAGMREHHELLAQAIDARYEAALRWVRRLGAEVHPAQPLGVSGLPFHLVVWRSPHV